MDGLTGHAEFFGNCHVGLEGLLQPDKVALAGKRHTRSFGRIGLVENHPVPELLSTRRAFFKVLDCIMRKLFPTFLKEDGNVVS
jgi:hypothetical protein